MNVSEARINANRINAQKSSGPKTEQGKAISRGNGLKHGLAGSGVVMASGDLVDVEALTQALLDEFAPRSAASQVLVRRMAVCSIQMDRGAEHETAAIAMKVRHAAEAFDDERFEEAERRLDSIGEDPRINLRKLRKTPEGVDRMIEAWSDLRDDVGRDVRPVWTAWHLERAVNLTGKRIEAAQGSLFSALSKTIWGDSRAIENLEKVDLEGEARKAQARRQLVDRIDAEIAGLQAHRQTLDLEMIELDRAGAGSRALFDPSPEAALARRYESDAQRNFFKALKELRQVEAELAARPEPEMGSPRESVVPDQVALAKTLLTELKRTKQLISNPIFDPEGLVRDRDGKALSIGKPPTRRP